MAEFSAKDVAALRKETGVGMMDCKKALADAEGDMEQAKQLLRERGLTKAGARSDRENDQGAVAIATSGSVAAAAQLRCETDFSAKSDDFVKITQAIADAALGEGEAAGHACRPPVLQHPGQQAAGGDPRGDADPERGETGLAAELGGDGLGDPGPDADDPRRVTAREAEHLGGQGAEHLIVRRL